MQSLIFNDDVYENIKDKRGVTIRKNYREIKLGEILFRNLSNTKATIKNVYEVRHLIFENITNDVLIMQNCLDVEECFLYLQKIYPDISEKTEITLIFFN